MKTTKGARHDPDVRKSRRYIGAGSRAATWLLALAVASAGCGGGGSGSPVASSTATPPPLNLQAQVSDPAGDAVRSPLLPVSPDLVSARLETSGGSLRLSARCARGTFDVGTTIVAFYLDTDFNPSTGLRGIPPAGLSVISEEGEDAALIGVDYIVIVDLTGLGPAGLFSCYANLCTLVIRPSPTSVADGVDIEVPLSSLRHDEGRLAFKVVTWGLVRLGGAPTETDVIDMMPNVGLPAGRLE